jgi:hemolysin III
VIYGGLFSKINHVTVYLVMGWLFILAIVPISSNVPLTFIPWLIGGALFYSFGSVIFILDSRSKWNWHIDGHNLWHLCVLSGSVCHFIVINHLTGMVGR